MEIPSGITISVEGSTVKAKGPRGEVEKRLAAKGASIRMEGNKIEVESGNKALKGTLEAHIRNMVYGVQNGYSTKMKMIYAHFPFTLEVKGDILYIKNLLGEKLARKANIIGKTKIEAKGQEVTISGPDKDAVGQTIANFKRALRIKEKDCRVFQDGVYEIA